MREAREKEKIEEREERLMLENSLKDDKILISNFNNERVKAIKSNLERTLNCSLESEDDYEILEKRKNLNVINEEFKTYTEVSLEIMSNLPSEFDRKGLKNKTSQDYTDMIDLHDKFVRDLINEVAKRDLNKEKMSPASVLSIKLGKFSGYESPIDIYSFEYKTWEV